MAARGSKDVVCVAAAADDRAAPGVIAVVAFGAAVAVERKTRPVSAGKMAPATESRSAGTEIESKGSAISAAAHAVHTMWRAAAEARRIASAASQATASTSELLMASEAASGHRVAVQFNIYLPSFFASSMSWDMRSSSSRVSRVEATSSSAATACSGEPLKKVSSTCLTAVRLALSRATVGR